MCAQSVPQHVRYYTKDLYSRVVVSTLTFFSAPGILLIDVC